MEEDGYDNKYDALARTIKIEDISPDEGEQEILRRLKNNDPTFDKLWICDRYQIDDEFDFGFAVDWMVKDLKICLDEATRNGVSLPVTEIVKTYYEELQTMNGGRWDTSSLIRRLRFLK